MRKPKDLCDSCAKFPKECPWVREALDQLEGKENNGLSFEAIMLKGPAVQCSEYEEERR